MKKRSIFGYIIGAIVMILTVGIVAALFTHELPQGNREVALVILGTVIGWASTIVGHEFGSSVGSKDKTALLAKSEPLDLGGAEIDR
ncbi:hypothetical protein [Novosphingobium mathurense]|uniref:Uncharacterized protein n=1 Tax=Novosphingobium mathurense TaxID=428990 RepID=A0A1U6I6P3_9SPHN|nr:hypothetical protein [Novosphingobium mathurense]SLK03690.1 hypothetical protein SAMN06295987_104281 [Novosphingobium mathurense]